MIQTKKSQDLVLSSRLQTWIVGVRLYAFEARECRSADRWHLQVTTSRFAQGRLSCLLSGCSKTRRSRGNFDYS